MDRIPPEVWELILTNLRDHRDCENASSAIELWNDILLPKISIWRFGQIFPLLLEYLPKPEILQCRLVCKHWNYGVDHFLENNPYHRPASSEKWPVQNRKIHSRRYIFTLLRQRKLDFRNFYNAQRISTLLAKATRHPRCPIVGRSAAVSIFSSCQVKNVRFLQAFGRHIWFLFICTYGLPCVETLTRILELLQLVPNLKMLKIDSRLTDSPVEPYEEIRSQLSEYVTHLDREKMRNAMPKLETLEITNCEPEIKQIIINLLCNGNLQSLSMSVDNMICNLDTSSIVDFCVNVDCERRLLHLLDITPPIRKLALNLQDRVKPSTLFNAIRHFKGTLVDLEISLPSNSFSYQPFPRQEWHSRLRPFNDKNMLIGFPHLKSVTLQGFHPYSINFLCGLYASLESLQLIMRDFGRAQSLTEPIIIMKDWKDELNLFECLKCPPEVAPARMSIYESKVWRVLPRLKVFSVHWEDSFHLEHFGLEYRRDVYERYQNKFIK